MKYKCRCHPWSPFHWAEQNQPSIFQKDIYFRASKTGQTNSQASTEKVAQLRAEGVLAGFLHGISRNREAELLRQRQFLLYSRAVAGKGEK